MFSVNCQIMVVTCIKNKEFKGQFSNKAKITLVNNNLFIKGLKRRKTRAEKGRQTSVNGRRPNGCLLIVLEAAGLEEERALPLFVTASIEAFILKTCTEEFNEERI